jgi:hypothetical protein
MLQVFVNACEFEKAMYHFYIGKCDEQTFMTNVLYEYQLALFSIYWDACKNPSLQLPEVLQE